MTDKKISQLTAAAALTGVEEAPVVQSSTTKKATVQQIITAVTGATGTNGETVTTSKPRLDLTQTWNDVAVTFTGLKFNAATGSSAGSASASLLLDLQLEGASQFSVSKGGIVRGAFRAPATGTATANLAGNLLSLGSSGSLSFGSSGDATGSFDTFLTRRAAANLRLGAADAAAPVAQTLSVQSVVAGTSNTAGVNLTITGSQGTGTGAGGSIIFRVAPAGSSGTAQNALSTALTIDSAGLATFANGLKTAAPSGGTSGTWKLGSRVAATTLLDTTQYIEVDVGGTLYKLAVVTS